MNGTIERMDGWVQLLDLQPEALAEELESLAGELDCRCAVVRPTAGVPALEPALFARLIACELPLVAVLSGTLSPGQADIAVACDVRVGEPDLVFPRSMNGLDRLRLLLRETPEAMTALWQGESLDAEAAYSAGLIGVLAEPGGGLEAARQLAATIASRGPIATRLGKEAVWRGLPQPLEQALRFETDLTLLLQTTKDRAEGVRAFLEKRPPAFSGA